MAEVTSLLSREVDRRDAAVEKLKLDRPPADLFAAALYGPPGPHLGVVDEAGGYSGGNVSGALTCDVVDVAGRDVDEGEGETRAATS